MDALKNIANKVKTSHGGTGSTTTNSNGDALDKGVDQLATRSGHTVGHNQTEKISDGIRTGFKKATGKDVPIQDKTYQ